MLIRNKKEQKMTKSYYNSLKALYPKVEAILFCEDLSIRGFITNLLLQIECVCSAVNQGERKITDKTILVFYANSAEKIDEYERETTKYENNYSILISDCNILIDSAFHSHLCFYDIRNGNKTKLEFLIKNYLYAKLLDEQRIQNIELKKLRNNNSKQVELISKIATIIGHDLKNPISVIISLSRLISDEYEHFDEAKIKELLVVMGSSAQHSIELIEDVVLWTKVKSGGFSNEVSKFDIKKIVIDNILQLSKVARNKKITIKSEVKEESYAIANEKFIGIVFKNLLNNALKYTKPDGNGLITIKSTEIIDNGVTCSRLDVYDNGIGIPPEFAETVFLLNKRHSTTGTDDEKGTGLGLIICKELIEKCGGKIFFTSVLGQGSCFSFQLPNDK